MAADVGSVLRPVYDFTDGWRRRLGLGQWKGRPVGEDALSDKPESEFHGPSGAERAYWIHAGGPKPARRLGSGPERRGSIEGWADGEAASEVGSEESEEGYVRDRILQNVLVKSQAIESENRTLRRQLALYSKEFKRVVERMKTAQGRVRADQNWVSDVKSVMGVRGSADLDDVLGRLQAVMAKYRIDEEEGEGEKCHRVGSGEARVAEGQDRMAGQDSRALLREIHRLRTELGDAKERINEMSAGREGTCCGCGRAGGAFEDALMAAETKLGPVRSVLGVSRGDSMRQVAAKIAGLKSEVVACRAQSEAAEGGLAECASQLESCKLQVVALREEVAFHRAENERLASDRGTCSSEAALVRERAARWRHGLRRVGLQVNEMRPAVEKISSSEIDGRLERLRGELAGVRDVLRQASPSGRADRGMASVPSIGMGDPARRGGGEGEGQGRPKLDPRGFGSWIVRTSRGRSGSGSGDVAVASERLCGS
eukprot:evm.model.scf_537.1 EVM.evm.TU.scf_537.1   scf_537:4312-6181(+)